MARINVHCSSIFYNRMIRCMPWGTQAILVRRMCELLCDHIEKEGLVPVVDALHAGQLDPIAEENLRRRQKL